MTSESARDIEAGEGAQESPALPVAEAPANGDAPATREVPGRKPAEAKAAAPKPRAGVPVWRTGKPDSYLAAAVDVARQAVEGIANRREVGAHLGAKSEGDRVVTHLFESKLAGYGGWQWYAVVTRNSRSKIVTVSELGLLPSEDSILAPEWVPWAKRVRPEDEKPLVEETEEDVAEETVKAGEDDAQVDDDADDDSDETGEAVEDADHSGQDDQQ
ncbi:DUF3027 domain-containing protein [Paenarthrobacter sp. NPDC089714]|uniref:DUF3027 domain-containing protein n=1 Tax=Paenarthrobacter sp. NPDC089714 TaxID=3364377 RepID=UPI003809A37D